MASSQIVIFLGPTMPHSEALARLDAVYLPPACQGDIYHAAQHRPRAIGIVDGCFDSVPSVWHKEILWAMANGIHVFGAASMGALRAAELAAFGMTGVGRIFEWFQSGQLSDDDEVAIIHGPAGLAYVPLSEAMVDIRCTLSKAQQAGVISKESESRLVRIAKSLFFHDRRYDLIIAQGKLNRAETVSLQKWIERNRYSQKKEDALALLQVLSDFERHGGNRKIVDFSFESTEAWMTFVREQAIR